MRILRDGNSIVNAYTRKEIYSDVSKIPPHLRGDLWLATFLSDRCKILKAANIKILLIQKEVAYLKKRYGALKEQVEILERERDQYLQQRRPEE